MSAHFAGANSARIRIKGRWPSVVRFFLIAVGFMMTWVLITSELHYYARWFGPQILLQLNFAFYLPSIPVLMISGQLEKCLDSRYGPISSMMIRLNTGLAGSAVLCAAFPFITKTHSALLWITAVLGTLSAIAFSTSYQLVQWFRHADIIALGIGGVGSGPLVLMIQLGLVYVKAWPQRWQWIAMFEISAGFVLLGLLSSLSLFGQYWSVLTGEQPYEDVRKPLLGDVEHDTLEAGESGTSQGRSQKGRNSGNWYPPVELVSAEEQAQEQHMALAVAPSENIFLTPDPFHGGLPVMFHAPSSFGLDSDLANWDSSPPILFPRSKSMGPADAIWAFERRSDAESSPASKKTPDRSSRRVTAPGRSLRTQQVPGALPSQSSPEQGSSALLNQEQECSSPFAKCGAAEQQGSLGGITSPEQQQVDGSQEAGQVAAELTGKGSVKPAVPMTLAEETWVTLSKIWPVLTAFLISVSIMYLVFPLFTYIPSSGLIGDALPRVLFFTRIGADIVGRFAPRIKVLVTRSPSMLFTLAVIKVIMAGILIGYLKMPESFRHDAFPVGAVLFLWTAAGYVNTCANILAPAMVPDHLCARASAMMALVFQIAHFAGLVLAAVLVYVMYGDIAG